VTRQQLEHAIRAACTVADDTEVYVFESQAILGPYPDAPAGLRQSVEADVAPKNRPENVDLIDGALGELSRFHETHGFYVHGVSIESATLPDGWKERIVEIRNANTSGFTGCCVESHDLAASKLVAFREKDRRFVEILLAEDLADPTILIHRIAAMDIEDLEQDRLREWVRVTAGGRRSDG